MRLQDLIWAAGFFDGEGSATVTRHKPLTTNPRYSVSVSVRQKKDAMLHDLFMQEWNGKVFYTDGTPHWQVSGKNAIQALSDMLPYLKIKCQVAEKVIEFYKHQQATRYHRNGDKLPHVHSRPHSAEEIEFREKLVEEIRELNRHDMEILKWRW